MWPNYYVADNYADEVGSLKSWLHDRIAWMDQQLGFDPNASLRGDVDGDGEVNITDVTTLIDTLLSDSTDALDANAADCDQDGTITISDVTALIDYLLAGSW